MPWPLAARRRCSAAPDAAAAAVSTAARIDRLTALGDAATAEKSLTLDIKVLRKSLERDRYGLVAQVLVARDGCTPVRLRGLPLADRSAAGRRQHGRAHSTTTWSRATRRPGMRRQRRIVAGHCCACRTAAVDADGQADQCGVPECLGSTPPVNIMNPEPPTRRRRPPRVAAPRAPAAASAQAAVRRREEAACAQGCAGAGGSTGSAHAAGRGSPGCG